MNRAEQFDKALDEAFRLIIQDRLRRARKRLLAKIEARKQERSNET